MAAKQRKFHINKENKKFLGVCAGLADYLEVDALIVRIVFIVSVFFGAVFLVPGYFIFYLCLDTQTGSFKDGLAKNSAFKHFKNVDYKKRLYRNTEERKFLGICSGIADYLEVDTTIVRVLIIILFFVAGPIPWMAYFAAYFILEEKPHSRVEAGPGPTAEQANTQESHPISAQVNFNKSGKRPSGRRDIRYCTRKFSNLHDRLVKMEAYITSSRFKLHQEFKDIS